VTCHNCQTACRKFGKHRNGLQRFRCDQCRKTFTEDPPLRLIPCVFRWIKQSRFYGSWSKG
jgi:hypothetical protein